MDTDKVIYTAVIHKESGKDVEIHLEDNNQGKQAALLKYDFAGRLGFLLEGINLLAKKEGLDTVEPISIEILSGERGTTVSRSGNGIPEEGISEEVRVKLLFLFEVLDRRLANYCELFEEIGV